MRLFIGISLPDSYQLMLGKIIDSWKPRFKSALAWTRPGNWHMTLKFLGETKEPIVPQIAELVQGITFDSFYLQGGRAGFFGSRDQYRVIWLGLAGDVKKVSNLAERIDLNLARIGLPREKRPFRGHLTLARVKRFYRNDPWKEFADFIGSHDWPAFKVQQAVLWQSILKPEGPRYREVCATKKPDQER